MMWHDPMDDYIDEITSPPLDAETEEVICELRELAEMDQAIRELQELKDFTEDEVWDEDYFFANKKATDFSSEYTPAQKSCYVFYIKAVGVTYGNRQQNIRNLKIGQKLNLVHEKNNQYDNNALLITTDEGLEIGYVSKERNRDLLNKLNSNLIKSVTVENITGAGYANNGVNIKIEVLNAKNTPETRREIIVPDSPQENEPNNYGLDSLFLACWGVIVIGIIIITIVLSGGAAS